MNRKTHQKHMGKVRQNRRVREKVSVAHIWRQQWDKATRGLARNGMMLTGVIVLLWRVTASVSHRLGVIMRLRSLMIRIGSGVRKKAWPGIQTYLAYGMQQVRIAMRHENRVALANNLRRCRGQISLLIQGMPGTLRRISAFMVRNKGQRLKAIEIFFDPTRVRTESIRDFSRHTRILTGVFVCGVVCCIAMGAIATGLFKGGIAGEREDALNASVIAATIQPTENISSDNSDDSGAAQKQSAAGSHAITADFYNPFYVFTQIEADEVSAYPLADPPGIVVDVHGMKEPDMPAADMIGNDDRVVGVRRLVTSKGLRYIIRLNHAIKRIKSSTDGTVITVSPLS